LLGNNYVYVVSESKGRKEDRIPRIVFTSIDNIEHLIVIDWLNVILAGMGLVSSQISEPNPLLRIRSCHKSLRIPVHDLR
jgi:hypothetical protein